MDPEDLGRYFLDRANAGDVDGLVALYEPGAVLASPAWAAGHRIKRPRGERRTPGVQAGVQFSGPPAGDP